MFSKLQANKHELKQGLVKQPEKKCPELLQYIWESSSLYYNKIKEISKKQKRIYYFRQHHAKKIKKDPFDWKVLNIRYDVQENRNKCIKNNCFKETSHAHCLLCKVSIDYTTQSESRIKSHVDKQHLNHVFIFVKQNLVSFKKIKTFELNLDFLLS